ncbi:hypothetical protein AB0H73_14795 [Streptomyces olivoreticuli]
MTSTDTEGALEAVAGRRLPGWLPELRPYLLPREAAESLCAGSSALLGRGWAWVTAEDWRTALTRLGYAGGGGYVVVYAAAHSPLAPFAMPVGALAWCVAAWMHAPSSAEPPEDGIQAPAALPSGSPLPAPHAPLDPVAFLPFLRALIGDRNGVLLRDLVTALREASAPDDWGMVQTRQLCTAAGVPVRRSVKTPNGTSPGVHRDDLPAGDVPPPPHISVEAPEDGSSPGSRALTCNNYPPTTSGLRPTTGTTAPVQPPRPGLPNT